MNRMKFYDKWISIRKAVVAIFFAGVLPAVVTWIGSTAFPTTLEGWESQGMFLLSGLLMAAWSGGRNWWKHKDQAPPHVREFLGYCLCFGSVAAVTMLLAGCGTLNSHVQTEFTESVTPEGGMETRYFAESRGEVPESLHSYSGTYDASGVTHVVVGQEQAGLTSPAQQQMVQMVGAMLPAVLEAVGGAVPGGGGDGTGEGFERVLAELEALRVRLEALEE